MALFELHSRPPVDAAPLVMYFDGFIDAGGAASACARALVGDDEDDPLVTFDSEVLLDYRARRPVMHLVDGVMTRLTWPAVRLFLRHDTEGRPFLLLTGPEPDHVWAGFARAVRDLALEFEVSMVINLGSYPAAAPHTRPPRLSATSTDAALAHQIGFVNATLEIPSGVHAPIEFECAAHGIPAVGLWAQVPHYVAATSYPASTIALFDGLRILAGLNFDAEPLRRAAAEVHAQVNDLISRNEEHQHMVSQLELQDDAIRASATADELPSGDEIAAEVEQFLREQD